MFRDTNSHGLISVQFICALGVFFGVNIEIIKINISELYQNLSYETLSGAKDFEYNSISDIVTELSYQIKTSTLQNRKRQREDDIRQMKKLIMTIVFFEPTNKFDQELVDGLFKHFEHKKFEHPYVERQVQDAELIDIKTSTK